MRAFTCKDCQREVESLQRALEQLERSGTPDKKELRRLRAKLDNHQAQATYNENWAVGLLERGGSRSDRCKAHRLKHKTNIQGMAVAYIDLATVGEVLDRQDPTGPLGGLGPLPDKHEVVPGTTYDLEKVNVGMTDEHIVEMVRLLREKQVLILKAGTGTGKSTFAPYRLMDPPPESLVDVPPNAPFGKLTELGQIIVTEPRVQAAIGVASFVGGVMSGVGKEVDTNGEKATIGGVGPGCPVGYQVSGDRNHDEACELVYVTDGTMINWLREGRLSRIGTVIVDEAHERSTNIDFIMGYLKRELSRYPHLRVIVTSATFNTAFYEEYFGGPEVANVMEIPAVKSFGYGMPLFPELDEVADDEPEVAERWCDPSLSLSESRGRSRESFITRHWTEQWGPPYEASDVCDPSEVGDREDVWDTTQKLIDLRFRGKLPLHEWKEGIPSDGKERVRSELVTFVVQLAQGLDREGIFGDILAFLPTTKTIEPAREEIERALGSKYKGHVFPLISKLSKDEQKRALAKRRKGDPRKIVISTNLAETSLTVEGVRFVVDSGIIAQSEWDPDLAEGGIPTKAHSQAGIKQRWGRVGRKGPGWVFPLYTKGQYIALAEDTPPGSTRENLEDLVMTAKMGGIDDVVNFPWPAAFEPKTTELDEDAIEARKTFRRELVRADAALRAGGAVDDDGHPTSFGKELARFKGLGSTSSALAILYADRLACVPEVATILSLLEDTRLIDKSGLLQDDHEWPDEWRLEAAERHRALAATCSDDAELVLLIAAAWERADELASPWEPSKHRQRWARRWFINNDVLVAAATKRQEVLAALSPAMKEEVKRFVEPALIDRARAVITRALAAHLYRRSEKGMWQSTERVVDVADPTGEAENGSASQSRRPEKLIAEFEDDQLTASSATAVIALRRREAKNDNRISSLVLAHEWALPAAQSGETPAGVADAMRIITLAAAEAPPDGSRNLPLDLMKSWPVGQRIRLVGEGATLAVDSDSERIPPFVRPRTEDERGKRPTRRKQWARRRLQEGDEPDATRADSDGDFNPVGRRQGYLDEEQLESAAFAELDKAQEVESACGRCFACLDGREDECEDPSHEPEGMVNDPLQRWLAEAQRGIDVSGLRLSVVDDDEPSAGWFEVVGYDIDDPNSPGLRVRRDWRPEGFKGNPAQHFNVSPGDPIEVIVGPEVRHHQAKLRIFKRTDGAGRFLVREASSYKGKIQEERSEIAASLDRRSRGLLADLVPGETLTATVVPARVDGCYTITLLELLHQHLMKASKEYHVLNTSLRNATREAVYHAVVEEPPNEHGYVTAMLLHQDTARGIKHKFTFNVRDRMPEAEEGEADDEDKVPVTLQSDQPLMLHIVRDEARLEVDGLDLGELEKIEKASNRQLRLRDAGSDANALEVLDADGEPEAIRVAGPGAVLVSVSEKPVSRSAAIDLANLDDSASWQNEVWAFWARSHHRKIHSNVPYLPGTATEVSDHRSEVELSEESPIEQSRALVAEFAAQHPVNSIVEADVEKIIDAGVFVRLMEGLDGFVPIGELSWSRTAHASDEVAPGDNLRLLVTRINDDTPGVTLSAKELLPKPYETFKDSHRAGEIVVGTVRKATDTHVYIVLEGGTVDGAVYVRELTYEPIERASDCVVEGQEIRAAIKGFNDERDQVELSVKALLPKPYDQLKGSHALRSVVEVQVTGMNQSFAYVTLMNGAEGSIHVGQLASYRVSEPSAIVSKGQRLRAVIIAFDDERRRVELSLLGVPALAPSKAAPTSASVTARPASREPVPARSVTQVVKSKPTGSVSRSKESRRKALLVVALIVATVVVGAIVMSQGGGGSRIDPSFSANCQSLRCVFRDTTAGDLGPHRTKWVVNGSRIGSGPRVIHRFDKPGTYRVRMRVIAGDDRYSTIKRVKVRSTRNKSG